MSSAADKALKTAARFWFIVVFIAQGIFVAYVVAFYGGAALRGNLAAWNKVVPQGHTSGDPLMNFAVATHLLLAVIVMIGGPLQLIPRIRSLAPKFHHWNGRVYTVAVFVTSLAGLYMIWFRGGRVSVLRDVVVSVDALLIMAFAVLAVRYAMARDLRTHSKWALRLFMVVNAGWFFRIGLMRWIFTSQGPVGVDPFLSFLSFADYLLPLAILELYLRTKDNGGVVGRFAVAGVVVIATVAMGIGIFAVTVGVWLPRVR